MTSKTTADLLNEGRDRAARLGRSATAPASEQPSPLSPCGAVPADGQVGRARAARLGRSRSGGSNDA